MEYRSLGGTGLQVPRSGTRVGHRRVDWVGAREEESLRALHRATELGVNLIDTARARRDSAWRSAGLRGQDTREVRDLLPAALADAGIAPTSSKLASVKTAHLNVLFIHFIAGFLRLVLDWSAEADAEIETWPDTAGGGLTAGTGGVVDDALAFYRAVADHAPGASSGASS